ncbi:MAG: TRAP transporter small permease [Rhizobiaceae bacterium]
MVRRRLKQLSQIVRNGLFVPAILLIIALLTVNIIDRFVLDGAFGIVWIEELCVIVMIWLIFLSAFAIDEDDLHIKVQVVQLPLWLKELIEDLAVGGFVLFLVWSTWSILPRLFSKYAALGWSIRVGYYAVIVGGILLLATKLGKYVLRLLR